MIAESKERLSSLGLKKEEEKEFKKLFKLDLLWNQVNLDIYKNIYS